MTAFDIDTLQGLAIIPVWADKPPHLGAVLELGRDGAYAAVHSGDIPVIRVGRRLLVPVPALLRLLGATEEN